MVKRQGGDDVSAISDTDKKYLLTRIKQIDAEIGSIVYIQKEKIPSVNKYIKVNGRLQIFCDSTKESYVLINSDDHISMVKVHNVFIGYLERLG